MQWHHQLGAVRGQPWLDLRMQLVADSAGSVWAVKLDAPENALALALALALYRSGALLASHPSAIAYPQG